MRDAHRMKEKLDLSLDNRQIVTVVIAGLVVLGTVFVLGVVVGQTLAETEQTAHAPDLLTALDHKAKALAEDAGHLTFQDELTRNVPAPPPDEPVAQASKDAGGTPLAVAPPAPPQEAQPLAEVSPSETTARTLSRDASLSNEKRVPEATSGGAFTLQLAASQNRAEADRFAAKLRGKGYAPYVMEAHVPGKGTWYRVRMGSFASKDAAQRYLQDFRRETQLDAFVTGTN